jgi:3-isopropylmalate dehydrogenase
MARVAVLAGDGIGPEVTAAAQRVLAAVRPDITFVPAPAGSAAIASHGTALPDETLAICNTSDAILFGAVGGSFANIAPEKRPEAGLLRLRKHFGLFANVRPVRVYRGLESASPLRDHLARGIDMVIVRELTGGLYFGQKSLQIEDGIMTARETLTYGQGEIERVVRFAFSLAQQRRKKLTSVDKANVLVSSQLWHRVVDAIAPEFPDVTVDHLLVDNAAMQLVRAPAQFDVIVTENMFGDILSDEAAMLTGSIGTAPSASLTDANEGRAFGLYEPIAGTAPDIAGRNIANPTGAILSAALLCRFSLNDSDASERITSAVAAALAHGPNTADLAGSGAHAASTTGFTDAVIAQLANVAVAAG